jgi:hypothetical protein
LFCDQIGLPLYQSAYGAFVARTANVDTLICLVWHLVFACGVTIPRQD